MRLHKTKPELVVGMFCMCILIQFGRGNMCAYRCSFVHLSHAVHLLEVGKLIIGSFKIQ